MTRDMDRVSIYVLLMAQSTRANGMTAGRRALESNSLRKVTGLKESGNQGSCRR